ncbi:MAG: zinc-ribbon domain-containing protein [Butyrivibrio sp.]|uniref:zinc ribbon domain-containing protein n=1 Tax=Butyrivibrio sp. TaxID=28121 RepID=UPI0025D88518|nr:zinc-ribbon domain-containing protein [Butyrivibrio sp.]MCR5772728.1 zinc-ribbon domain-containing protein [Butyrivibrio sp.]
MKKKDKQNAQQVQARPPKKGIRLSTIIDVFMFITGILLTIMFFLPVYKDAVAYDSNYFKFDNLFNIFPDNAASYLGLAGRFLDDRNVAVTIMIFSFMFVMPILLAVFTFPKLRKISALAILPIIILVGGQFFFGAGFIIEQKALEFAPLGFFYSILIFELPVLYIIFIIQSIIEAGRIKKEAKNAPVVNNIPDPSYQQYGPQGGFGQPMGQEFVPQGGYGQPQPQQFGGPQGDFGQPMGQQYMPQGGFEQQSQPMNNQQFASQDNFQQAPVNEQQPQNNFYSAEPSYNSQMQEEVSETVAENTSNVYDNASNAFEAADNASEKVEEAVTENLSEAVEEVSEKVEEANEASEVKEVKEEVKDTLNAAAAEEPVKMQPAFCQQCGAKLEPGALFCMQCGAPVK